MCRSNKFLLKIFLFGYLCSLFLPVFAQADVIEGEGRIHVRETIEEQFVTETETIIHEDDTTTESKNINIEIPKNTQKPIQVPEKQKNESEEEITKTHVPLIKKIVNFFWKKPEVKSNVKDNETSQNEQNDNSLETEKKPIVVSKDVVPHASIIEKVVNFFWKKPLAFKVTYPSEIVTYSWNEEFIDFRGDGTPEASVKVYRLENKKWKLYAGTKVNERGRWLIYYVPISKGDNTYRFVVTKKGYERKETTIKLPRALIVDYTVEIEDKKCKIMLKTGVEVGNLIKLNVPAYFLKHALLDSPNDLVINDISNSFVVDAIKDSEEYKKYMKEDVLQENLWRSEFDTKGYGLKIIEFKESTDLFASFHYITPTRITGKKQIVNGKEKWITEIELFDIYDFDFESYHKYNIFGLFFTSINNYATVCQNFTGITPYNIYITIKDEF